MIFSKENIDHRNPLITTENGRGLVLGPIYINYIDQQQVIRPIFLPVNILSFRTNVA